MKILVAPDSFKDSLSALKVAEAIKRGIKHELQDAEVKLLPLADGGEGTVSAMTDATNGVLKQCKVKDALMRELTAEYGLLGDGRTAIIEMAAASGIETLTSDERNPWLTTSYGTGEMIKEALDEGVKRIVIGIGGSATNDGGVGMAMALGVRFLDSNSEPIGFGGGEISRLAHIDISGRDKRLAGTKIMVACDVNNPLTGTHGASFVFGPQKGADKEMAKKLDNNLKHFAAVIRKDLELEIEDIPGAGAAGGLGAGLMAFTNARLQAGFEIVARETKLEKQVEWANLVITGEGKIDFQTQFGKTPMGVATLAKKHNKTVFALAGTLGENYTDLYAKGFDAIFPILNQPMELEYALRNAPLLVENTARAIAGVLKSKQ